MPQRRHRIRFSVRLLTALCIACGVSCAVVSVSPSVAIAQGSAPATASAGVIARSLALEARGDLHQARQVVVDAFGATPTTYEPCIRLAELSLQMQQGAESVRLYRRARELPGSQADATLGLGLALTMLGYDEVAHGAFGRARGDFLEALIIDSDNREAAKGLRALGGRRGTGVDLMASTLSTSALSGRRQLYAVHVPVRIDEKLALRFAFQQLNAPDFAASNAGITATTQLFAGVVRDAGISTVEAMGILSTASGMSALGGATSLRVGGRIGGAATLAVMGLRGSTSVQVAPTAFVQLHRNVRLSAGARVTHDDGGSITSPIVALSVRGEAASFEFTGHSGRERAAFAPGLPTLQPYLGTTTRGATGVLALRVRRQVSVLASTQVENSERVGTFRNFGLGVRIAAR